MLAAINQPHRLCPPRHSIISICEIPPPHAPSSPLLFAPSQSLPMPILTSFPPPHCSFPSPPPHCPPPVSPSLLLPVTVARSQSPPPCLPLACCCLPYPPPSFLSNLPAFPFPPLPAPGSCQPLSILIAIAPPATGI